MFSTTENAIWSLWYRETALLVKTLAHHKRAPSWRLVAGSIVHPRRAPHPLTGSRNRSKR
jgi:hypothetical protein